MFLMVKGAKHGLIKGESQDAQHKGEIEVLSWSWGMQGKASLGGGAATGKAAMHDLKITKRVDSASTALMLALRTNEPIQKAVLTLRKAGKAQLEYMKVTIEQGRVMSLTIDGGDNTGTSDSFVLAFIGTSDDDMDFFLNSRANAMVRALPSPRPRFARASVRDCEG